MKRIISITSEFEFEYSDSITIDSKSENQVADGIRKLIEHAFSVPVNGSLLVDGKETPAIIRMKSTKDV